MLQFLPSRLPFVAGVLILMVLPTRVLADRIDGDWCRASSHFRIDGPKIIAPAGTPLTGDYSRHGFVYTVPANEPGAGLEILMVLLNEETVQLTRGSSPESEIWRRCKVTS